MEKTLFFNNDSKTPFLRPSIASNLNSGTDFKTSSWPSSIMTFHVVQFILYLFLTCIRYWSRFHEYRLCVWLQLNVYILVRNSLEFNIFAENSFILAQQLVQPG
uniref:Uncharacterized protein n=1 Tax=Cacopsylla melanoneura TaxID=428564 RepID=A0A8D8RFP3_9HEMI